MCEKLNIGIMYLCVHNMLDKKVNNSRIYPKKEFYGKMLGEIFHVPKHLRVVVMKEMEKKGLIKDLGTRRENNIFVNRLKFNLETDTNKFYQMVGLY